MVKPRLSTTVPALPVRSVAAAVTFYSERLGFEAAYRDEGFAVVLRDEAGLHLWQSGDESWQARDDVYLRRNPVWTGAETFLAGTSSCRVRVDDVDALHAELAASRVLHPADRGAPVDQPWGTREFATLDVDGNQLTFFRVDGT